MDASTSYKKKDDSIEEKKFFRIFHRRNKGYQVEECKKKTANYLFVLSRSTRCERFWISLAIFLAIVSGCMPPLINVLYGEFVNVMMERQFNFNRTSSETNILPWFGGGKQLDNETVEEERMSVLKKDSFAWAIGCSTFAFCQLLTIFLAVFIMNLISAKLIMRLKVEFFRSILCKDMGWFDVQNEGNFAGLISENMSRIRQGLGEVIVVFIYQIVTGTVNIILCFYHGWLLSIVLTGFLFPLILSIYWKSRIQTKLTISELQCFTKAGNIAEEVFSSIKTVVANQGEKKELKRYKSELLKARKITLKKGLATASIGGFLWFITYMAYSLGFVFGVRLIRQSRENGSGEYTGGILLIIFFGILAGLTNYGFAAAHIETFAIAKGAATPILNVLTYKPSFTTCSESGGYEYSCTGEIEFKNVHFHYPGRASLKILRGINLKINPGEFVALVGASGSGKSTILHLIQRMYDPSQGEVLLDGKNLKSLNLNWLRQQIAVVGQEPSLFSTTIEENIALGNLSATHNELREATIRANAHTFISGLPNGYATLVSGSKLSGGQKQRIAIARALIKKPKVLLLDEVTSALDAKNEAIVQDALDVASEGITTVVVTHRLQTIRKANRIVFLKDGEIAEEGTHEELIKLKGLYYELSNFEQNNFLESSGLMENKNITVPTRTALSQSEVLHPLGPRAYGSKSESLESTYQLTSEQILTNVKDSEPFRGPLNLRLIMKWNKPEWYYFVVGSISSIVAGAALPTVCFLFGQLSGYFTMENCEEMLHSVDFVSGFMVLMAVITGLGVFLQLYCFAAASVKLSYRLRALLFEKILHQEMGWHDLEQNRVGALCLRLTNDVAEVQGAIGSRVGILLQSVSTIGIALTVSLLIDWKLSLVSLSTVPFVFGGVYMESLFLRGIKADDLANEKSARIAVEVVSNIKTVHSLGREDYFVRIYKNLLEQSKKMNRNRAALRGFAIAVGHTAPMFGYALALWYGGKLVAEENLHFKHVVAVTELLIFGAWTLGQCVIFSSSFREAKLAAGRIQYILQRKPSIVSGHIAFYPFKKNTAIKFSNVSFSYPSRSDTSVLDKFSLKIETGESVAILGASGSGKSTIIQLLLRFYDPVSGTIQLDDIDLVNFHLSNLRGRFALVSQEPVLFQRSIQENIAYGANDRVVTMSEIENVAKLANIHNFIKSLPLSYDTKLGRGGSQLSGGQKQRIAIARALIRNPNILLLDEATSALDIENEKVVQEALNVASEGRTTIIVAHRQSAYKNAKKFCIMSKGKVVEFGTHDELIKLKGQYYSLQKNVKSSTSLRRSTIAFQNTN